MPRRTFDRSTPRVGNLIDMKTGKPVEKPMIPIICERVRYYRERNRMEQKELSKRLGITANSISNWENGRARPDINLIPALCDVLHVTLYDLFGMKDPTVILTENEQSLIDSYRNLSEGHRFAVRELADSLRQVQQAEECPRIRQLPLYEKSLAAGIGDPTEFEDEFTPVFLYADNIDSRADCVFSVSGDSMEPKFHDGDLVIVERIPNASELKKGETGAFIISNEIYIKNLGKDGLESINPNYKPILFNGSDSIYLIGRVLGTLDPEKDLASDADIKKYVTIYKE